MSKMIVSAWLILLASTALGASLAACRQVPEGGSSPPPLPAASPTFPLAASPIPSPTSTPEPTNTPEPEKPATGHKLSPQNAASQTYENNQWVVKNADGLVTAQWNSTTSEWIYNMENIHQQIFVVENYKSFDPASIPAEMLTPLADYTSGRLTDGGRQSRG